MLRGAGWERGWLGAGRVKCAQPGGTGIKGPVVAGAGSAPRALLREPCAASWGLPVPPPRPRPPQLPAGLNQGQHLPAPDVTGQAGVQSPLVPSRPTGAAGAAASPGNGAEGSRAAPHSSFSGSPSPSRTLCRSSHSLEQPCSEGRNVACPIHHPKEHQQHHTAPQGRRQHPQPGWALLT